MRSGRDDLGGEQTWRPEHYEISAASKHGSASCRESRSKAGSRPHLRWGKADDTGEETGRRTRWDRRGTGSSIQGKIFRDNVGKLPWAAGAAYNLQGLFERGSMPKEERAQGEWHMSPYERGPGGNALGGDGHDVSPMEVTPTLGKGAQDTWRFPRQWGGRLDKTGMTPTLAGRRGRGQTRDGRGAYDPAFQPLSPGKAHGRKPRFQTGPGKSGRPGL
jgi:hypothetical protein